MHAAPQKSVCRALPLVLLLTTACLTQSPVGTTHVGPERRESEVCALYSDQLSASTAWFLQLIEADEDFEADPLAVLEDLQNYALEEPHRGQAYSLAELSYLAGKRTGDRGAYLLSAVAALTFLEGDVSTWGPEPSPYRRRFRWACEFYNRSIGMAFAGEEPGTLELRAGSYAMPGGQMEVELDLSPFPFDDEGLELLLAYERKLRGLQYRVRDAGLGAPLIAVVQRKMDSTAADTQGLNQTTVSATAFLRLDGDLLQVPEGLTATLELHSTYDAKTIELNGHQIPLEADQSATVAYGTELAGYWKHDLSGLLEGGLASQQNGLVLPRPFEPGRIPVVLVHGTASSPTYWADLLNTLGGDPAIRARYQFWLFFYNSGNPIAYTAGSLRKELTDFVERHDPDSLDPALQRMVLVGHSQGGLLVRMMGVTISADQAAINALGRPVSELGLEPDQEELLRFLFDVEPLPFVESLVFIATPHRGSYLAESWLARMLSKMITVPGEVVEVTADLVQLQQPEQGMPDVNEPRLNTSLDNMNPDSKFLRLLRNAPFDPRLSLHSIIAIGDATEPEGATDGVIAYESAHLPGVASEVLVPAKHSCQSHPRTMMEIRRILRTHIGLDAITPSDELPSEDSPPEH